MKEFLPLIIGIVWLIYTFYSRGQKKKSQERAKHSPNAVRKEPSFIEQLFAAEGIQVPDQEADFYEEEDLVIQDDSNVSSTGRNKIKPFLNAELSRFNQEGGPGSSDRIFFEEDEFSDYSFELDFNEEIDDFDLKKAVVYSEILNPPYIDYK